MWSAWRALLRLPEAAGSDVIRAETGTNGRQIGKIARGSEGTGAMGCET
jgi:hypothetical protein